MTTLKWYLRLFVCALVILNLGLTSYVPVGPSQGLTAPASQAAILSSRWACNPPLIDGEAPHHEWGSALSLPFLHGSINFLNDSSYLYILIDVAADITVDPLMPVSPYGDYFWLTFDVNRDALITPEVDLNYTLFPSLPYSIGRAYYLGPGVWTGLNPTAASFGTLHTSSMNSPQPHRVWEMAIPLREIGAVPGQVVRTGMRAHSVTPEFTDDVPLDFYKGFTDLVEIALVEHVNCEVLLQKSVLPTSAAPGDIVNYQIDYQNYTNETLKDVVISDALPPELKYLPGSAVPAAVYTSGALTFKVGDLAPGARGSLIFQALVLPEACYNQRTLVNYAWLTSENPPMQLFTTQPADLSAICGPLEFPNQDPPYAESEITVHPYPLVTGQLTRVCTTISNNSDHPEDVEVIFSLANFGIGLPFTPIPAPGNPRTIAIPPHSSVMVCILWVPEIPGHSCIQVTVIDADQQFPDLVSQRNLDVDEVLKPGEPSTFAFPVGNPFMHPVDIQMVVRSTCPGWSVLVNPGEFSLNPAGIMTVAVTVTPPAGFSLGSGCTLDLEAWVVDQNKRPVRLIGGIRKIDQPQLPLGEPGEPPFAEKEIRIDPYPIITGRETRVCVNLVNSTDTPQTAEVEFQMSNFGIGLAFNRIPAASGLNPRTVTLPPHSSIDVCITFLPGSPGHHCIAVKLTSPDGYVTYSYRNLDVAELLEPNQPAHTPVSIGNPTPNPADIDLVVDNTCRGWSAYVTPSVLFDVAPHSTEVYSVTLTVIPPDGLLGTDCHIDLLAYIDGVLIGGVRKIDRMPVAPTLDQPPYAEEEITVSPDPPVVGQNGQVCAKFINPTGQDQTLDVTFAAADFGAGIPFTPFRVVSNSIIPAHGALMICVPWTPEPGGTLHRCLQIKVHQEGYLDLFSQRNVNLMYFIPPMVLQPPYYTELPPFIVHNPLPEPAPFQFDVVLSGLNGLIVDLVDSAMGEVLDPGQLLIFDPGEIRGFFLRLSRPPQLEKSDLEHTFLIGDASYIDVIPYVNGMPLLIDGVQSGIRFVIDTPPHLYLPLIPR